MGKYIPPAEKAKLVERLYELKQQGTLSNKDIAKELKVSTAFIARNYKAKKPTPLLATPVSLAGNPAAKGMVVIAVGSEEAVSVCLDSISAIFTGGGRNAN